MTKNNIFNDRYSRFLHFHKSTRETYKYNFIKYRKFVLIFVVIKTAIKFKFFFILLKIKPFSFNNIMKGYSRKWEIKSKSEKLLPSKQSKTKNKDCEKINYAGNRSKNISDQDEKEKNNI